MIFTELALAGVFLIEPQRQDDERGFFARTWCADEFERCGLNPRLAQCSISFNHRKGTLRGMHYQQHPHAESKLVRVTRGATYDVALDLRRDSRTFKAWVAVELTADNHRMLYIPAGVAHGFQTLADDTEVFYQISTFHQPASAAGVRWNDSAFGIKWPLDVQVLSTRDASYASFDPARGG